MDSVRIKLEKLILIGLTPAFLAFHLRATSGVVFFIALSLILISSLVFLKRLGAFFAYFQRRKSFLNNLLLTVTSIMLSLILFEFFLCIFQSRPEEQQKLVMPQEWKKRAVSISGASRAYYWHNILHVHDRNYMRRTSPFPPKSKRQFRIMVVGDSLTYGYGVREEETYPMQIETALKKNFNIEVLNLGVSGYQSEDLLKIITEYTPLLQPNLIIYGVCLNDFLPSGVGEYQNNMAYRFPFPETFKRFLSEKTYLGRMVSDGYNHILIKLGLRNDFYTDILKDFKNYQMRFARDVKDMNMFVLNRGLPPVVAMVLNQFPDLNSNGYQIALIAEEHLKNAGLAVISTKEYYHRYDKQKMVVSPWEGHPNAKANQIFADLFIAHLQHRSDLNRYKLAQ